MNKYFNEHITLKSKIRELEVRAFKNGNEEGSNQNHFEWNWMIIYCINS